MKCPVCKGDGYAPFDSDFGYFTDCKTCGGTGEVDKIKEEFERICTDNISVDERGNVLKPRTILELLTAGYNAADLLPTEKDCPDCGNVGILLDGDECNNCNGSGTIQIYYTPEQYEKIMGEPYRDDALVWEAYDHGVDDPLEWGTERWIQATILSDNWKIFIVQTDQPPPPADYRPEK